MNERMESTDRSDPRGGARSSAGPVALVGRLLIVAVSILVCALVLGGASGPGRTVAVAGYILIVPGLAWAPLLRLGDRLVEGVVAIALSLSLALLASTAALYAGLWSPDGILVALAAISVLGVLADFAAARGNAGALPRG